MGRARRTRKSTTHPAGSRYTPPQPPKLPPEFFELVTINGQPIGVVMGYWCNDPECQERHL